MAISEEGAFATSLLRRLEASYPDSLDDCLATLKTIKHSLIGHEQAKQLFIEKGVIPILVRFLQESNTHQGLKLEAGICIGSLAYGGESFAIELLREGALGPLIAALDIDNSPAQLVLTSLRTLNTLFDTCPLEALATSNSIAGEITHEIYSNRNTLQFIERILAQTSESTCVQQQISLAATLVSRTCSHGGSGETAAINMEKHQKLLISHGILEVLGRRLAGFVVRGRDAKNSGATRYSKVHDDEDKENNLPPPAPMTAKLAPILDAIAVIIKNNSYRAYQLLYAPWILSAFPAQVTPKNAKGRSKTGSTTSTQPRNVPQSPTLLTASAFPPLTAAAHFFQGRGGYGETGSDIMGDTDSAVNTPAPSSDTEDTPRRNKRKRLDNTVLEESPLVRWLIGIVRTGDPLTRLMATSLLTNLCQTRLTGPIVKSIEHMVLPILVRLLDDESTFASPLDNLKGYSSIAGYDVPQRVEWIIRERAPSVLADLVNDDAQMQKAAVEGNAIKRLAGMFKRTFEVAKKKSDRSNGVSGRRDNYYDEDPDDNSNGSSDVNTPYKIHRMKVRESTLKCIAGITSLKDDYRKLMIDTGIVPYVVAALQPTAATADAKAQGGGEVGESSTDVKADTPPNLNVIREDNPPRVLIAAAYVIRSFSRSVHILRTNLVDAKVATPLMALLKYDDVEVKNAATMALCNLVLDFSPMRQPIIDMGALKIFCEQAHSANVDLKLNSVWALKHLVLSADNEVKTTALKELGSGWLADLISWDDEMIGGGLGMNTEYAGNRNEAGGYSGDEDDEGGDQMKDSIGQLSRARDEQQQQQQQQNTDDAQSSTIGASPATTTLHHQDDTTPSSFSPSAAATAAAAAATSPRALRHTRQQLISVQEQGFNFIRNLICGNNSAEILDLLFTGVGQDRVFEILTKKLKPKYTTMQGKTPATEILVSVIFILVHIAANHARHRQTLVEQTTLLKALLPLFSHESMDVRVGLAWVVINLTWKDDSSDEVACRARAAELRRLGFVKKMEGLLEDRELDVRERAKAGLCQIRMCLEEGGA
ncbi:armadillo-type protein [Peziza echinospora]|nr:armadillo-type protein [Peziza echinospora]